MKSVQIVHMLLSFQMCYKPSKHAIIQKRSHDVAFKKIDHTSLKGGGGVHEKNSSESCLNYYHSIPTTPPPYTPTPGN